MSVGERWLIREGGLPPLLAGRARRAITIGHLAVLAVVLGAAGLVVADRLGETEDVSPEGYLDEVVTLLRDRAYFGDQVLWELWGPEIQETAAAATSTADTYPLVRRMIASLSDGHTRLLEPNVADALLSGRLASGEVPTGGIDGDVGVVRLPGALTALDSDAGHAYVHAARAILRQAACGWILDARGNTGGDLGPMLAAIAPLLRPGPAVRYRYRDGTPSTFIITDDGGIEVHDRDHIVDVPWRPQPFTPTPEGTPVAVLQDHLTGSSGEGIVMAFRGRGHVRTFGTPSAGVPTGVAGHELPDGSVLAVTETVGVDASGAIHTGPIPPDESTATAADNGSPDPTIGAANAWLTAQSGCAR